MRTAFLFTCLLFISVAVAASQQTSNVPAAQAVSSQAGNAGPITVRGCVSGGKEAYTLAQSGTGVMFKLQGDTSRFEQFRGQQIEVTARELPPPARAGTGLNNLPVLMVKQARVVGDQCPFRENSGAPVAAPTNLPQNPPPPSHAPSAATPRYASPGAPNQTAPNVPNNPNTQGANGAPSPGTGNTPPPASTPPQ